MRKSVFLLEPHDELFEGYTLSEKWNGFACPYFDFEQAQRIVTAIEEEGGEACYDEQTDSFIFSDEDGDESEVFPGIDVNGCRMYRVGNCCWIKGETPKFYGRQVKLTNHFNANADILITKSIEECKLKDFISRFFRTSIFYINVETASQ